MLLVVLVLSACQSVEIPNVRIHAAIPFIDGEEAVFVETLSGEKGELTAEQWAAIKPYIIGMHIRDWVKIKKSWYKVCRMAGKDCNVEIESIDKAILQLDQVIKIFLETQKVE